MTKSNNEWVQWIREQPSMHQAVEVLNKFKTAAIHEALEEAEKVASQGCTCGNLQQVSVSSAHHGFVPCPLSIAAAIARLKEER